MGEQQKTRIKNALVSLVLNWLNLELMELRDRNLEQPGSPVYNSGCRPCSLGLLWTYELSVCSLGLMDTDYACNPLVPVEKITLEGHCKSFFQGFFLLFFFLRVVLTYDFWQGVAWFGVWSLQDACFTWPHFFRSFVVIYFSRCVDLIAQASPSSLEPFFFDFIFVLPVRSGLGIKRNFMHLAYGFCINSSLQMNPYYNSCLVVFWCIEDVFYPWSYCDFLGILSFFVYSRRSRRQFFSITSNPSVQVNKKKQIKKSGYL